MNVTYLDLGPWGAMKRAIDALRSGDHEGVRVSKALAILEAAAEKALSAADTGEPVDLVAIVPADAGDTKAELARAMAERDLVELSVQGRVVGVLQVREGSHAS